MTARKPSAIESVLIAANALLPYVQDEADKYIDDGSNQPLEDIREFHKAVAALRSQQEPENSIGVTKTMVDAAASAMRKRGLSGSLEDALWTGLTAALSAAPIGQQEPEAGELQCVTCGKPESALAGRLRTIADDLRGDIDEATCAEELDRIADSLSAAPTEAEGAKLFWVIERSDIAYEGRPAGEPLYMRRLTGGKHSWTHSIDDAIQFAREVDAKTERGAATDLRVVQHMYVSPIQQAPSGEVHQWRWHRPDLSCSDWAEGIPEEVDRKRGRGWAIETRTLYAAPVVPARAQEDARDAERYRFAREQEGITVEFLEYDDEGEEDWVSGYDADEMDEFVDAAIAARTQGAK